MKKNTALSITLLFIVTLVIFLFTKEKQHSDRYVIDGPELVRDVSKTSKKKPQKAVSERKKRIKGDVGKQHPDLFAEFHHGIRTRDDDSGPAYPPNYKIKELLKARSLTSTKGLSKVGHSNQLNWIERGPGNVSGRTRSLLVYPGDPTFNTWIAGSVSGGVWKTENAGQTWTELTADLPNLATSTLAMGVSNPNVIYAGTGEGFFNVDQVDGSGIWKSMDGGATWEQLTATANNPDFQNIMRLIVDPSNENVVLAATAVGRNFVSNPPSGGIFRSIDGGVSWTRGYNSGPDVPGSVNDVQQIIANPKNFDTQYATINSAGVIKSTDGGLTWQHASNGIGEVQRLEIAISPSDTSRLYISAQTESGSDFYSSTDAGAIWFRHEDFSRPNWLGSQGWYDNTIAVHPYNDDIIFVGGINIWQLEIVPGSDTSPSSQVTGIERINTDSFLSFYDWNGPYLGGGLGTGDDFWSFDGGAVDVTNNDFVSVEIKFGPGESQKAHRFTRNSSNGNYEYHDYIDIPFTVWDFTNNVQLMTSFRDWENDGSFNLVPHDPDNVQREYLNVNAVPYNPATPEPNISKDFGLLYKNIFMIWPILTSGSNWDPSNLPESVLRIHWGALITKRMESTRLTNWFPGQPKPGGGTFPFVHADHHNLILIPTDPATNSFRIISANDGGVEFSDNSGTTWKKTLNGYNTTQFYGIDKMNGGVRYIGGTQDNGSYLSPLNPDKNSSWIKAPSGDGFEAVWHYQDANKLLESSQFNDIRRSFNGGLSWSHVTTSKGLRDIGSRAPFFTRLAKSKQDPDLVFAIGESGVWRTDNFASRWTLTEMPQGFNGTNPFSQIVISLANPQIVWTALGMTDENPPFVSTDGGLSFLPTNIFEDVTLGRISGLDTHPTDENTGYVMVSFARGPKILRTTDLGQTWEDLSGFGTGTASTNGFPDVAVYSLLVMPFNTNMIWVGTDIGIFESLDGGATWAFGDNGFPAVAVYEMLIVNDEVVVATHGRGVWTVSLPELIGYEPPVTTLSPRLISVQVDQDGVAVVDVSLRSPYDSSFVLVDGEKVLEIAENNTAVDTEVNFMLRVEQPDTLAVSLHSFHEGRAFKSASFDLIVLNPVSVATEDRLPTEFNLSQNYPNPFNPTTRIEYALAKNSQVNLHIFNVLGQRIRSLVEGEQQAADFYTILWDAKDDFGRDVSSGVYFYKIEADDFVKSYKMMLLK